MQSLPSVRRWIVALILAARLAAPADAQGAGDVGTAARSVLEMRCAPCHAPESEERRAKRAIEDVLDFAALRAEWIPPGGLEASEMWLSITDPFEPMPPVDAKSGQLSPAELYVLREWIAAGGPDPTGASAPPVQARERAQSRLGRLHPVSVHFPIALLMTAALAELLAGTKGRAGLRGARRFLVQLGALGAVASAGLGWLAAGSVRASDTLEIHRWLGVATAVAAILALVASERAARKEDASRRPLILALFGCALLAGAAGWYGGILVWGAPISWF